MHLKITSSNGLPCGKVAACVVGQVRSCAVHDVVGGHGQHLQFVTGLGCRMYLILAMQHSHNRHAMALPGCTRA